MKSKNIFLFLAFVFLLFQGCIPSLHPLYTADKLVTKKEVVGVWVEEQTGSKKDTSSNDSSSKSGSLNLSGDFATEWHFSAYSDGSYGLVYYDSYHVPAIFDAHLILLGGDYFFNFSPSTPSKEEVEEHPGLELEKFNEFEAFHYCPTNTFAKVIFENGQLGISLFNGDFLEKLLDKNRIRIKHEKVENGYILTAQPEELQKFILKYADDENAFPDPLILTKAI